MAHLPTPIKVAVIIPVFNPPSRWDASCIEHMISLQALHPQYKFHFTLVNDGSPNYIFYRIRKSLKQSNLSHRLSGYSTNRGKGYALRSGVRTALKGAQYCIFADWDFPFGVFPVGEILDKLQNGSDVVLLDRGVQYLKDIPPLRSFLTRSWRIFIKKFLHIDLPDTQAGMKGLSRHALPRFLEGHVDSFLYDLEFVLTCMRNKMKISTVKVELRGGVKLNDFSLKIYLRELKMLVYVLASNYFKVKYAEPSLQKST